MGGQGGEDEPGTSGMDKEAGPRVLCQLQGLQAEMGLEGLAMALGGPRPCTQKGLHRRWFPPPSHPHHSPTGFRLRLTAHTAGLPGEKNLYNVRPNPVPVTPMHLPDPTQVRFSVTRMGVGRSPPRGAGGAWAGPPGSRSAGGADHLQGAMSQIWEG